MLKMDLDFKDFNDNPRTETHYFNMSERDRTILQLRHSTIVGDEVIGGFQEFLTAVRERGNGEEIGQVMEDLILTSYGIKSEDGSRFQKSKELREDFAQTAAYNALFIQIVSDEKAMESFVRGIYNVPADAAVTQDKPNRPYPVAAPTSEDQKMAEYEAWKKQQSEDQQ